MPIARIALPVSAETLFDYWIPDGLDVHRGRVVAVALGARRLEGVVVETTTETDIPRDRLRGLGSVDADSVGAGDVRELAEFVAAYYQAPPGMALGLALPPRPVRRAVQPAAQGGFALTTAGRAALQTVRVRAPAAAALYERLAAAPGGLAAAEVATLGAHAKRLLRGWRARNFKESGVTDKE
jgi:primosomal protein N'